MGTVLVVDDEPIVRDVVVRYLEQEGYRTLQAGDGETARSVLEQEKPSLVVLDLMLPGTDGLALCRWIRARSDLPVIMVTALGEESDRLTGLELGADDYLTKPFSARVGRAGEGRPAPHLAGGRQGGADRGRRPADRLRQA